MSGFPIRTPWDHSLVDSSPRPIAASHVLHRLLVPRHPPFALDNLTTENKMLASTVQFSTNDQPTTPTVPHQPRRTRQQPALPDGMRDQVMPGAEKQPPRSPAGAYPSRQTRLFFQDPTGCYVLTPSPAASPRS